MPLIDEQKFLEIYDQCVGKIYRYIYFRLNSAELAQDLTSEVFLKSWQFFCDPEKGSGELVFRQKHWENPRAFIYQVARNLIVDFYRKKDKNSLSLEEISVSGEIADKKDSQAEQLNKELEFDAIKRALAALSPDYQEIIIWRYLDEMEIKEIALILDKSEGTVRTLLSRALGRLKEVLK